MFTISFYKGSINTTIKEGMAKSSWNQSLWSSVIWFTKPDSITLFSESIKQFHLLQTQSHPKSWPQISISQNSEPQQKTVAYGFSEILRKTLWWEEVQNFKAAAPLAEVGFMHTVEKRKFSITVQMNSHPLKGNMLLVSEALMLYCYQGLMEVVATVRRYFLTSKLETGC